MLRIMLLLATFVVVPLSHQEAAMYGADPVAKTSEEAKLDREWGPTQAAQGPIPEPVSVMGTLAPASSTEPPALAQGRRTLSTAFVRIGPDGFLTVRLNNGRVLILRDVVMRRKDYCGIQMRNGQPGTRYCGSYADVAAARPGGGVPVLDTSLSADPVGAPAGTRPRRITNK